MSTYFYDKLPADLPIILNDAHPLSTGHTIKLLSDSKFFSHVYRTPTDQIQRFFSQDETLANGMCIHWSQPAREIVIFINGDSSDVSLNRFFQLVAHECSHAVDFLLREACVENVDTEVRAYYLDWLISAVMFCTSVGESLPLDDAPIVPGFVKIKLTSTVFPLYNNFVDTQIHKFTRPLADGVEPATTDITTQFSGVRVQCDPSTPSVDSYSFTVDSSRSEISSKNNRTRRVF